MLSKSVIWGFPWLIFDWRRIAATVGELRLVRIRTGGRLHRTRVTAAIYKHALKVLVALERRTSVSRAGDGVLEICCKTRLLR